MTKVALRKMTHSLSFDGVDDYVEVPDAGLPASTFTSGFTLSGWILPKGWGESNVGFIFSKDEDATGLNGFFFGLNHQSSVDTLRLRLNNGTVRSSASKSIVLNKWQHVVASVASDGTVSFYIDGVLSGTPADLGDLDDITTTNALRIGNRATATDRTFDGNIGTSRIFNSALTATEVSDLYHHNIVPTDSLVAEYFNSIETDGAGTTLTDSVGSNDGTISGATWSTEVPIKEAVAKRQETHALSFDGVNDYVNLPDNTGIKAITDEYAVSFSMKMKADQTDKEFVTCRTGENKFLIRQSSSKRIDLYDWTGNSGGNITTSNLELNRNYLVTVVRSTTAIAIYIDGVLNVSKTTGVSGSITITDGTIQLGSNNINSGAFFTGEMWDLKVWNTAPTAQEVYNLYHHNVVPTENLVAEYFNSIETDGAGTTLTDSVGSNDGTISGATWLPLPQAKAILSVIPDVLSFDGNDYAQATAMAMNASMAYTFDLMPLPTNTNHYFLSNNVDANNGFGFKVESDTLKFRYIYGGTAIGVDVAKKYFNYKVEQRITVNVVDSVLAVYIDGVRVATTSDTSGFAFDSGKFNIGAGSVAGSNLIGTLANTITHSDSLTPQEILNLHTHGIIPEEGLVGNWNEISDDGTTLVDNSGNSNDGTISGATRVKGGMPPMSIVPYVGSVEFDGVDDEVTGTINEVNNVHTLVSVLQLTDDVATEERVISLHNDIDSAIRNNKIAIYGSSWIEFGPNLHDGKFHTLVWVRDGETTNGYRLYVDGLLVGTTTRLGTGTSTDYHIASRVSSGGFLKARIASNRIYNRALTTAEVKTLTTHNVTPYDNNSDICVLNLEAKTDVLSGSSWRDVSGNGNNGTITGATLSAQAPSIPQPVDDGNLAQQVNGDFSKRPYNGAATTGDNKWIDGTAAGSDTNDIYGWYDARDGASFSTSFVTKDGRKAIKLSTGDATGRGRVHTSNDRSATYVGDKKYLIPLKPSTNYKLNAWVKTNNIATNSVYIRAMTWNGALGDRTIIDSAKLTGTNDWQLVEKEFTTESDAVHGMLELSNEVAGNVSDAWFSDIRLEEI